MTAIVVHELRNKDDILTLIGLGHQMREELQPNLIFDEPHLYAQAEALINDPIRENINCWVAYDAGEPIGFFIGYCNTNIANKEKTASHEYWFVKHEYRKSRAAFLLIRAFEEWARLNGSTKIIVGVALDDLEVAESVAKLFPKIGYKQAGTYFVKKTVKEI